jgi:hypothetical protein
MAIGLLELAGESDYALIHATLEQMEELFQDSLTIAEGQVHVAQSLTKTAVMDWKTE